MSKFDDLKDNTAKGDTIKIKTGCGSLFCTFHLDENGKIFGCWAKIGKSGTCGASQTEAIGRLVTMLLESNIDPTEISKQLKSISCHQSYGVGKKKVWSCADGIAIALNTIISRINAGKVCVEKSDKSEEKECCAENEIGQCPDCGGIPFREEGCMKCSCGWSKCS